MRASPTEKAEDAVQREERSVMGVEEREVTAALGRCYDPCCRDREISVVDMGLIEEVRVDDGEVRIEMLLTTGWCPFVVQLHTMMEEEVEKLDFVGTVEIEVVWEPAWTMDRLSESARDKLTLPMEELVPLRDARLARR